MFAAMARGARTQYANRVDLALAGMWTVPAGVTSVNVYSAMIGGMAATTPNWGVGAGGGGAAILNCALTVVPGNVIAATFNYYLGSSLQGYYIVSDSTTAVDLFRVECGYNAAVNAAVGAGGGGAYWYQGASVSANGGSAGASQGNGGNGQRVACAGGWLVSGGGGGGPALLIPLGTGGKGGNADTFDGIAGNQPNGGGGGGFFPGQYAAANSYTLVPSTFSSVGFIWLEWN